MCEINKTNALLPPYQKDREILLEISHLEENKDKSGATSFPLLSSPAFPLEHHWYKMQTSRWPISEIFVLKYQVPATLLWWNHKVLIHTLIGVFWCWFNHSVVSDSWDPLDCSPPGFSVHGILQARILEWVAIYYSSGSSQTTDRTRVSCTAGRFLIGTSKIKRAGG